MLILELTFHVQCNSEIERMLQCNAFFGNPDSLSLMLGGAVVLLVCGFIRQDSLLARRGLFGQA